MKIIFTGDLFLGGDLLNKSAKSIIKSKSFHLADKRIMNLEQPISDNNTVVEKSTLYTGSKSVLQLKDMKVDAVNLAHNHIHDKSLDGIVETIKHLEDKNIGHFGAGKDISEASEPYYIKDDLCILGYCDFDKSYLNNVEIANAEKPGVNPLRINKIIEDIEGLPEGVSVVVYLHWGKEHVWLPRPEDIQIVKQLLNHKKVATVIGMHAHRAQGYIKHNGKTAYMCLGNFLFSNFYIKPRTQIAYPIEIPKNTKTTRQYHSVSKLTYKKWRLANRISLMIKFDSISNKLQHIPVYQKDKDPIVVELNGISKLLVNSWITLLSLIYKLPNSLYKHVEKTINMIFLTIWRLQIGLFITKQTGIKQALTKAKKFI